MIKGKHVIDMKWWSGEGGKLNNKHKGCRARKITMCVRIFYIFNEEVSAQQRPARCSHEGR